MASLSFRQFEIVEDTLQQIHKAILDVIEWKNDYICVDELLSSADGMKTLAANCMLIEAIGEGFKNIDNRTNGELLKHRSDIPWHEVMGMRNRIAHGYFDINSDLVWDVIRNDLPALLDATDFFLANIHDLLLIDDTNQ